MKKTPHFYGGVSRLGTKNNPNGTQESNEGVELAYESILGLDPFDIGTLKQWGDKYDISSYTFPDPSSVSEDQYFSTIAKESKKFGDIINGSLKPEEIAVSIGGDHSISYATIQAWLERIKNPKKALVIDFDSHADACLYSQTPSGNFGGMWARPFLDKFDVECIDNGITKLQGPQWLYIGDLEGEPYWDPWEAEFLKEKEINHISKKDILEGKASSYLQKLLDGAEDVYTTADIDVFTKKVAPATGITGEWGLTKGQVFPLLEQIAESGKLSGCDLTEVNPQKQGAVKTIGTARAVLETLIL